MRRSSCLDDARQVEQDASCLGRRLENRVQQVAAAAADVDDPAGGREVVRRQDRRGVPCRFRGHGLAEDSRVPGLRPAGIPTSRRDRSARSTGDRRGPSGSGRRTTAATAGSPIIWGKARIDIGWSLRSSRDAGLCWYPPSARREHTVRGQQAKHPVQPVRIDLAALRQLLRGDRMVVDVVGDAELCHHLQASGGHARVGDREDQLVRFHGGATRSGPVPGCERPRRRTRAATG